MATISIQGKGDINKIASILISGVTSSGITCELTDSAERIIGGNRAKLLVFEKYYMRSDNRASLSVMLTENDGTVFVDAVGAGGGQGALFRFSWGAEESFVSIVPSVLSKHGFS